MKSNSFCAIRQTITYESGGNQQHRAQFQQPFAFLIALNKKDLHFNFHGFTNGTSAIF